MELRKLTDKVFYFPHQPQTDRPMLAYINGEKVALAIDAGNSADHVDEFYNSLKAKGLKSPDLTAITHWHWDHTFGMHHIHGLSIAHRKTNEFLRTEMAKLSDSIYADFLKDDDECLRREYADDKEITVVTSDIEFGEGLTINLGGMTAEIFHTESPHSQDTVLIYIPEERVLFLGDSICEDFFNNGYMDYAKLNMLINVIESTDSHYLLLSHEEPMTKSDLLKYLKRLI